MDWLHPDTGLICGPATSGEKGFFADVLVQPDC